MSLRSMIRRSPRGRSIPLLPLLLLVLASAACDRAAEEAVVASVDDYSLTLQEVRSEYDRVNEEGAWDKATVEERADFASLLLDKQMLLMLARENCPEPDTKRARLERILAERTLIRVAEESRREQFPFPPERKAELIRRMQRAAKVRAVVVSGEHMKDAASAIENGVGFDDIVGRYGFVGRDGNVDVDTMTIAVGVAGRELVFKVLLDDPAEGSIVGPAVTRLGPSVSEILSFEPIELDADPRIQETAETFALDYDYLPVQNVFFDSLRTVAAVTVHDDAVAIIRERFEGFWDSVRATPDIDLQALRAPLWRFDETDRAVPAYELFGETHTVGEYVESLNDLDLDVWPPKAEQERVKSMVEQRALRLVVHRQAIAEGYDRHPEYLSAMERMREQQQLEQFRDRYLASQVEVPEERMRKQYEDNPEKYETAEQISYGMLVFPPSEEARAHALRAKLKTGQSWDALAQAEVGRGTGVLFEPDTGLRSIRMPPSRPSWIPFRNLATTLQPGEYSAVTQVGDNFSIVRCNERAPARLSTYEEARPNIHRMMLQIVLDEEIERRLEAKRAELEPVVHRELLAVPAPAQT